MEAREELQEQELHIQEELGGGGTTRAGAGNGSSIGGAGGYGAIWSNYTGGGGAGNPGGAGGGGYAGETGTGGLLMIYADTFTNKNVISSNGSKGGAGYCPGGSSGGGSINVFYNKLASTGAFQVNGGVAAGNIPVSGYAGAPAFPGGKGTVNLNQVRANLNYDEKSIELKIGEEYIIDKNNLTYVNPHNGLVTNLSIVGNVTYEVLDANIAEIEENGRILGKAKGETKVKITDITNNTYTYIFVEVVDGRKVDVKVGKNFTIALKKNGTVWSYGKGANGELGNGGNTDEKEPVQVQGLEDIVKISAGYSHSLALNNLGEVYAFGLGTEGQLGDGLETSYNVPIKVDGLNDIIKITAYGNTSVALDSSGNVFAWGAGFPNLPMKIIFSERITDISGKLMLTKTGLVYDITNITAPIEGLSNIAKIAGGENHNLAINPERTALYLGNKYLWRMWNRCGRNNKT